MLTSQRALIAASLLMPLLVCIPSPSQAQLVFNLANDWSDTSNPNGAWAYGILAGATFTPFATHTNTYIDVGPPAFTGNQPAWVGAFPAGLAKSLGISLFDFPVDRVGGHTPASSSFLAIQWTAPVAGTIDISGDVWMWRDLNRVDELSLIVNGSALFSSVNIPEISDGVTSSSPYLLSDAIVAGSGSPSDLLGITVDAGDTVILAARRTTGGHEDFVGFDFTVQLTPVPEPSNLLLLGMTVALAGGCWRWRRRAGASIAMPPVTA